MHSVVVVPLRSFCLSSVLLLRNRSCRLRNRSCRFLPTKFLAARLEKEFGSQLDEVRLTIHRKEFGSEKPDKNFNVYVEWNIEAVYKSHDASAKRTSVSADRQKRTIGNDDGVDVPNPDTLVRLLVRDTDVMEYLLKAVQPIRKTAFANVTMGYVGAKVKTQTSF